MRWLLPVTLSGLLLSCFAACGRHNDDVEPVGIARFDIDIVDYASGDSAARDSFRHVYSPVVDALRGLMPLDASIIDRDSLTMAYAMSPGVRVFAPDVRDSFPAMDGVGRDLGRGRGRLLLWNPVFSWPEVYGVISTYNQAIVTTDSAVLVAMNHFLGKDYPGYSRFDDYQRRLKEPWLIAPMTLQAILASRYPYRPAPDASALNRMVYDGALLLAAAEAVAPDSVDLMVCRMLGWTEDDMGWADSNRMQAWLAMADRGLLYSSDATVADRLTRQSPATTILHPQSPGRMGSYFGVLIARAWLRQHDDATPLTLLDSAVYNAPSLLIDAHFVP